MSYNKVGNYYLTKYFAKDIFKKCMYHIYLSQGKDFIARRRKRIFVNF